MIPALAVRSLAGAGPAYIPFSRDHIGSYQEATHLVNIPRASPALNPRASPAINLRVHEFVGTNVLIGSYQYMRL